MCSIASLEGHEVHSVHLNDWSDFHLDISYCAMWKQHCNNLCSAYTCTYDLNIVVTHYLTNRLTICTVQYLQQGVDCTALLCQLFTSATFSSPAKLFVCHSSLVKQSILHVCSPGQAYPNACVPPSYSWPIVGTCVQPCNTW
jgi:hypothetical protein